MRLLPLETGYGPEIAFDRPILLIGRHEECDIAIDSRRISRKHCLLALLSDSVIVRDLGSTNGVMVNGKRVTEARVLLGDELSIGGCRFRLERPEAKAPASHNEALKTFVG